MPVTIGAGSKSLIEDSGTPGTYLEIVQGLTIPEAGEEAEAVDTTPVNTDVKEYITGVADTSDMEFRFNLDSTDAGQQELIAQAKQKNKVNMRFDLSNNERASFAVALLGYKVEQVEGSKQLVGVVKSKQSGGVTWGAVS